MLQRGAQLLAPIGPDIRAQLLRPAQKACAAAMLGSPALVVTIDPGQLKTWVVDFDADAVIDFDDVKSRGDRKAVLNAVQKLKDVGPALPSPHMKSLKGRADPV